MYAAGLDAIESAAASAPFKGVVARHVSVAVQYIGNLQRMYDTASPALVAQTKTPIVIMIVGAAGIGKSTTVTRAYGTDSVYMHDYGSIGPQSIWPDYDPVQHSVVFFDEFSGQIAPHTVKKMLSGQGIATRQVGGRQPVCYPDVVVFASQTYPADWTRAWQSVHEQQAFARRVHFCTDYLRHDLDVLHPTAITDFWDEWLWLPLRQHFENATAVINEAYEAHDRPLPSALEVRNLMQDQRNMRLNLSKWETGGLSLLTHGQTM